MADRLLLKWGSLKGWDLQENKKAAEICFKWQELGVSLSAALQEDTPEQKQLLCDLIMAHTGEIKNDWDGDKYTKDQAIDYIMNYRKR